jgi:diguanylate cyclase (GGDEF)-like protein
VTDPLTGVCNRRRADELLTSAINDARRYHYPLSLMMLDIDHFKDVNDEYGHHIGDDVLVELTSRLRGQLRGTDVLARWGGEEFVVLSGRCTHAEAVLVAEKLRSVIADSPFGHVGTITISIGIAELHPADDLRSWMRRADKTMYEAKTAGRNTIKVDA